MNEELFLVLEGTPAVRLASGEHPLAPLDLVLLPPGPESAHQLLNRSDAAAVLLALSTRRPREVVEYPDSSKRLFVVADLEGDATRAAYPTVLRSAPRPFWGRGPVARVLLREGAEADYYDGEPLERLPPGTAAAERDPRIVPVRGGVWEELARGTLASRRRRVGRIAGGRHLGASVYRIASGERPFPYHLHHVNEELALVLTGEGRLRGPAGVRPLRAGDLALFPPGPEGAHALEGTGAKGLEVLIVSTMEHPEVVEYPDGERVYVLVGDAPGGTGARTIDLMFRRSDGRAWSARGA